MSWIQKTHNPLTGDEDEEDPSGEDEDTGWTKEDKEKARQEGEEYHKNGMPRALNHTKST